MLFPISYNMFIASTSECSTWWIFKIHLFKHYSHGHRKFTHSVLLMSSSANCAVNPPQLLCVPFCGLNYWLTKTKKLNKNKQTKKKPKQKQSNKKSQQNKKKNPKLKTKQATTKKPSQKPERTPRKTTHQTNKFREYMKKKAKSR